MQRSSVAKYQLINIQVFKLKAVLMALNGLSDCHWPADLSFFFELIIN